jgi:hypothetical protein
MIQKFGFIVSVNKVINIKNKCYEMVAYFLAINIGVEMTSRKACVKKKDFHFNMPSLENLRKTIERILKATNKARVILNITKILFHVNFFLKIPMQKCGFNIHPMDLCWSRLFWLSLGSRTRTDHMTFWPRSNVCGK